MHLLTQSQFYICAHIPIPLCTNTNHTHSCTSSGSWTPSSATLVLLSQAWEGLGRSRFPFPSPDLICLNPSNPTPCLPQERFRLHLFLPAGWGLSFLSLSSIKLAVPSFPALVQQPGFAEHLPCASHSGSYGFLCWMEKPPEGKEGVTPTICAQHLGGA